MGSIIFRLSTTKTGDQNRRLKSCKFGTQLFNLCLLCTIIPRESQALCSQCPAHEVFFFLPLSYETSFADKYLATFVPDGHKTCVLLHVKWRYNCPALITIHMARQMTVEVIKSNSVKINSGLLQFCSAQPDRRIQ